MHTNVVNRTADANCKVCLGPVEFIKNPNRNANSKRARKALIKQLWNYRCHQNVRESLPVTPCEEGSPVPKLTFTFSMEKNAEHVDVIQDDLNICGNCCQELEKLDQLHQQLEAMKKSIESRVRRLSDRRAEQGRGKEIKDDLNFLPKMQMSLGGSVLGQDNIGQTLRFLGNLCDGISSPNKSVISDHPATDEENLQTEIIGQSFEATEITHVDLKREQDEEATFTPEVFENDPPEDEETQYQSGLPISSNDNEGIEGKYLFQDDDIASSATDQDSIQDPLSLGMENPPLTQPHSMESGSTGKRSKIEDPALLIRCTICGKRLHKHSMTRHMRAVHSGSKPFQCDYCPLAFSKKDNHDRHRRIHTGEKPFACDLCHERFNRRDRVKQHKALVHCGGYT